MAFRTIIIAIIITFLFAFKFSEDFNASTYHITTNSVLKIDGSTNVNSFSCACTEDFNGLQFFKESNKNRFVHSFNNTHLNISIYSLDCGNKIMNKDLQSALNAKQFPNIKIELIEAMEDNCNPLNEFKDWVKIKAKTKISLNGNTNDYWLDITAKKINSNKFRFMGIKTIKMSDFCVEPPTAMFGMVKVSNEIKINMDLEILINSQQ